ncbi:MAG: transposase [Okeania sp. SIO2C2]|uniref:hypothetical protein n=1 Tax=Okeania sp. SIO2C2 TaxID=2607787 RepID=UPI0013BB6F7A|nr:hypothetical protein [Okeania sp. SIO2C2]NEP87741.1 transposase [Okeania sp. SIO2C2]
MSSLCVELIDAGSYIILDAYFASKELIEELRKHNLRLITRVRISPLGKHPLPTPPLKRSRGRPRIWGKSVKLRDLFDEKDCFTKETLLLYGKMVTLRYRAIDLHWDCPLQRVRFVLAVWPEGKQIILLSTDVTLSATEILTAYSWLFQIEVTFRNLIQLLSGFSYRFWIKDMTPTQGWPKDLILSRYPKKHQQQVQTKVEAMERFVLILAMALAVLQLVSLEMPMTIWKDFPHWFRTLPCNGYPSEQIVLLTLAEQRKRILAKSTSGLLSDKILNYSIAIHETVESGAFCHMKPTV